MNRCFIRPTFGFPFIVVALLLGAAAANHGSLLAQSPTPTPPRISIEADRGRITISADDSLKNVLLVGAYRRHNGSVWESGTVEELLDLDAGTATFSARGIWSPESIWIAIDPITGTNALVTGGGETPRLISGERTSQSLLEQGELHLGMDAAFVWLVKPKQKGASLEIVEPDPGTWSGVVYDGGSTDRDRQRDSRVVLGLEGLHSKDEAMAGPTGFSVDDLILAIHPKNLEYSIEFVNEP